MLSKHWDLRGAWRSIGRWVTTRCIWIQESHTNLKMHWWDMKITWEVPSYKCWTWYWMNKLAVSLVNKAFWPQFGPSIVLYHGGCVEFFQSCVWQKHTMCPVISLRRHRNAHRNAPQSVCWHSWSWLSDVDKDVLLGFTRFTPWRHSGSCQAVTQDIATF